MLKLTTDKHEASSGLSATAELLVLKLLTHQFKVCKLQVATISQFSHQFIHNMNSKVRVNSSCCPVFSSILLWMKSVTGDDPPRK